MTNKQKQEIDFLKSAFDVNPTKNEIEEYFGHTVKGEGIKLTKDGHSVENCLFQAKRRLDITVKMWTEDLANGLLGAWELTESFNNGYATRLVKSIMKGIIKKNQFEEGKGSVIVSAGNRVWYLKEVGII